MRDGTVVFKEMTYWVLSSSVPVSWIIHFAPSSGSTRTLFDFSFNVSQRHRDKDDCPVVFCCQIAFLA